MLEVTPEPLRCGAPSDRNEDLTPVVRRPPVPGVPAVVRVRRRGGRQAAGLP